MFATGRKLLRALQHQVEDAPAPVGLMVAAAREDAVGDEASASTYSRFSAVASITMSPSACIGSGLASSASLRLLLTLLLCLLLRGGEALAPRQLQAVASETLQELPGGHVGDIHRVAPSPITSALVARPSIRLFLSFGCCDMRSGRGSSTTITSLTNFDSVVELRAVACVSRSAVARRRAPHAQVSGMRLDHTPTTLSLPRVRFARRACGVRAT